MWRLAAARPPTGCTLRLRLHSVSLSVSGARSLACTLVTTSSTFGFGRLPLGPSSTIHLTSLRLAARAARGVIRPSISPVAAVELRQHVWQRVLRRRCQGKELPWS